MVEGWIRLQLQVTNSPFNQEQVELLGKLVPTLTETQRIWLCGYLSALQGTAQAVVQPQLPSQPEAGPVVADANRQPAASREVTILFGSQTGNSEGLSKKLAQKLEAQGFQVTRSAMRDFKPNALKKVQNLLVVVSTHGEGEPPDNAISFYEFLHSKRAPQLNGLQFSVLALGDTSYAQFCQTGKDFDKRLEELGGKRICPRVDCDVDFDEPAAAWIEQVVGALSAAAAERPSVSVASVQVTAGAADPQQAPVYSRTNPFRAEVLDNINLNGRGSDLETHHLALSLEGSGFRFEPGDCVGIYPENRPELVDELIRRLGWQADAIVPAGKSGEQCTVREALLRHYDITTLSRTLLEQIAPFSSNSKLQELLQSNQDQALKEYVKGRDLLDLVQDFGPWQATPEQLVPLLRKLPARLYSIASSYRANPDEVHLVIRAVRYEAHGRKRHGVCSTYVADRLAPGDHVSIYIQTNSHFRLPENPDAPIIMIGPGTGVAPFRAFMEEREVLGAKGKSWLFYGDRRFLTDFLYQIEWQRWLQEGVLTRMDVAFSRDTDRKIYVQHRMLEKSRELYAWLNEGAYIYVCGDKARMARDVHETLITILEREGGLSREAAEAHLADLQRQNRYQRDVY